MVRLQWLWLRFWMRLADVRYCRKFATGLALLWAPPYFQRHCLADMNARGFIALNTIIYGTTIRLGANVFIDNRVLIYQDQNGGPIEIGDRVRLQDDTHIQTAENGTVEIGADTHIHRGCQLTAAKTSIRIGCRVEIAARCAFYTYDHGCAPAKSIAAQPLQTKGGIMIEDEVWLGYGVIVLSGVRIGKGAVVGAGAVVTRDVPPGAIAVGVPARVVKMRDALPETVPIL